MQQMVLEFEHSLREDGSPAEIDLYTEVKKFLETNLARPVDLEAVFSVIDSIIHWSPDRVGPSALYHAARGLIPGFRTGDLAATPLPLSPPGQAMVGVASSLGQKFEEFIRSKCEIPDHELVHIQKAYRTAFERIGQRVGGVSMHGNFPVSDWPIFTTNYDPVLEHYWIDHVKYALNTGFSWNDVAGMKVSNPDLLRGANGVRLFKLHGSVTWLNDPDYGLTEQRVIPKNLKKWTGSRFLGQVMIYPVEEKALYVEPYLTMFLQLNRELAATNYWLVIGYSFGDRFIRDMFVRNSRDEVYLALIHPHAAEVVKRLEGFRGRMRPVEGRFGGDDLEQVCESVIQGFTRN
jgi:hypothetical protein